MADMAIYVGTKQNFNHIVRIEPAAKLHVAIFGNNACHLPDKSSQPTVIIVTYHVPLKLKGGILREQPRCLKQSLKAFIDAYGNRTYDFYLLRKSRLVPLRTVKRLAQNLVNHEIMP